MGPNDAELVRVYTRNPTAAGGDPVADVTFPFKQNIEVVVDVEAGYAIFGLGAQYEVGVVVRDLSDGSFIPTTSNIKTPDSIGSDGSAWTTQATSFVFTIQAESLGAGKENHICEVLAYLRVGVINPDISFARSSLFMIQHS